MTLKSLKTEKSLVHNHAKENAYFTDHEKIENQFPEDGKI